MNLKIKIELDVKQNY